MTRGKLNKLYRTFVKGLITEAGFLTYPEDSSTDELNTVIHRKGNRSRRLGLDYEPDGGIIDFFGHQETDITVEYLWKSVGNKAEKNFLCVQVGNTIHFLDTSKHPLSSGLHGQSIDLNSYKAPTATLEKVSTSHVHMSAGKGWLFIAGPYTDPISVEYDAPTNTFKVARVVIQIRDFDGVNDGLANDQEPTTLSAEHHYNLKNQGWVTPGSPAVQSEGGGGGIDGGTGGAGGDGGAGSYTVAFDPYTGEEKKYDRWGDGTFETTQEVEP